MSQGFENGQRVEVTSWDPGETFQIPILHIPTPRQREFNAALNDYIEKRVEERTRCEVIMELQRFLGEVPSDDTAGMVVDCYKFAVGLVAESEQDLARKHGVLKATISKRVVEITERLHIPPSRGMKSLEARETFRRKAKESHAKRKTERARCTNAQLGHFNRAIARAADVVGQ